MFTYLRHQNLRAAIVLLCACAVVAACSTSRVTDSSPHLDSEPRLDQRRALLNEAKRAISEQRVAAARQMYDAHIADADVAEQQSLRVIAAEDFLDAGHTEQALAYASQVQNEFLDPDFTLRNRVLGARLALFGRDTLGALALLPEETSSTSLALQLRILETRIAIFEQMQQISDALDARIKLETLLSDPMAIKRNQLKLWDSVYRLPREELDTIWHSTQNQQLRGWLALAIGIRNAGIDTASVQATFNEWRSRYPEHGANQDLLQQLQQQILTEITLPPKIALLLPLSGKFAGHAEAIRNGFLSAFYDAPSGAPRPTLRIYDTGGQSEQAVNQYKFAVEQGARLIIGPLIKASVDAVLAQYQADAKLMTLNYSSNRELKPPTGVVQFGLLPEDEARQVADKAVAAGFTRAVALVSDDEWGNRMLVAFRERMSELGASLVAYDAYRRQDSDFGRPIKRLMSIDVSQARARLIRELIGNEVKYEPRRRTDIDFAFIAANPRQARLIKPQFAFYHSGELPILATSQAYSAASPTVNQDLNGLIFSEIPWLLGNDSAAPGLNQRLQTAWPNVTGKRPRLFALGYDAFNLIPFLARLQTNSYAAFPGLTGLLSIARPGYIRRELDWAQFVDGKVIPQGFVPTAAATATQ